MGSTALTQAFDRAVSRCIEAGDSFDLLDVMERMGDEFRELSQAKTYRRDVMQELQQRLTARIGSHPRWTAEPTGRMFGETFKEVIPKGKVQEVREQVFLGNGVASEMRAQHLHEILDQALELLSGLQQTPEADTCDDVGDLQELMKSIVIGLGCEEILR